MKRITTLLVCVLSVAAIWAQTTGDAAIKRMNPYTCQLSHAVSVDGKSITFSYYLNATATSIDVMVDVDRDGEFENHEVAYTITGSENANILTRSDNQILSVTIPFTAFNAQIIRGTDYNWALRANRAAYSTATHAYPADWGRMVFNIPGGVAVNNNPENDYFGTIYVTESKTGDADRNANGSQTNYHKDEGLYIYKSDLTQYKHTGDRTCFTGDSKGNGSDSNYENLDWSTESNDDKAPDRVCIGSDGVAFINDNRASIPNSSIAIWQASPTHTHVRNNRFMYAMKNNNSTLFPRASTDGHPRVLSMVTMGNGNNEKLYVINAYKRVIEGKIYQYYPILTRYNLSDTYGNQITNEETAAKEKNWRMRTRSEDYQTHLVYDGTKYSIANATTSMASGVHNDLWIAQRREASIAGVPSLVHVKFSGEDGNTLTCDYVIDINHNSALLQRDPSDGGASPYGALALNTDGTMLAIASDGYINVMDVMYSSDNKTPTLTRNENKSISLGSGNSCNALAFDKANNLYAVSQDTHQFYIYAMPGQASTTIPEQEANTIDIPHVITCHSTPTTANEVLVYPSYTPPTVSRAGYVFAGWYFGDANSYDINTPYDPSLTNKSGHLHVWARWIKATFEEGYVTATIEDGFSQQEIDALSGKGINRNEELASYLSQDPSYLQNNNPIKVNRKLQGGMYNTFMLPFTLTSALRDNIIDNGSQPLAEDAILTMQRVESHTANGETIYELVFAPTTEVPAYQPFLIKPTNDLTATITFPNVSAVEALPVQPAAEIEGVRFVPVFEPTMMGGEESNILILVADNRLAQLSGSGEMLGLRGYFDVGNTLPSASYAIKIVDRGGVVTYIGDITTPQKGSVATKILHNNQIYILRGNEVYTLSGHRVK